MPKPIEFEKLKSLSIVEVVERYNLQLTQGNVWRYAKCPLPSHDQKKSRETKFAVNVSKNYWTCFSGTCKERREGQEYGDAIDFVVLMDGCGKKDAAEKLAEWFGLVPKNEPVPVSSSSNREILNQKAVPESWKKKEPESPAAKSGYMAEVDAWFDKVTARGLHEDTPAFWARVRKEVKTKLLESFRAGVAKNQKAA